MSTISGTDPVLQGYLLKKKKKKLQGLGRRYFRLSAAGVLSYSFNPTSPTRDSVLVSLSYVRANRKQRMIHIDNGTTVMHCKALTEGDFDRWTKALREFIGPVQEAGEGAEVLEEFEEGGPLDLEAVKAAVSKMSGPLHDLEALHQELSVKHDSAASSAASSSHQGSSHHGSPHPNLSATPSPGTKFKFLKKGNHSSNSGNNNANGTPTPTNRLPPSVEDYFDPRAFPPIPPSHGPDHVVRLLGNALSALRAQHHVLHSALQAAGPVFHHAHSPSSSTSSTYHVDHHSRSPTPVALRTYASRSSAALYPARAQSRASSVTSGEDVFYEPEDAVIPGEFVLEDDNDPAGSSSSEDEDPSFVNVDEVDEEELEEEKRAKRYGARAASELTVSPRKEDQVVRRKVLPAPTAGDEFSMLGMLRKNVGKDLSTISFPVTMNEPLSGLQRIAEEFEYADLLHKAAATDDPMERLMYVATFEISGVAGNKYRSSRKPFNPLLGETYECIRPDKGFRFVSEKVTHHPPVLAFHADAKAWTIDGHIAPNQKFWGRSMEVFMHGEYNVTFNDTKETYSIKKPSSFVRNLVAGTKYLEVVGDLTITNETTGAKAIINFKEGSTWGGASTRNKIEAKVYDALGDAQIELVGRWDEHVDRKEGKDSYQRLWRIAEYPPHAEKYYGFSTFAAQLNETTSLETGAIPPTDSRLRPDQLALEAGDVDLAEEEKKRVEEKQRTKRAEGRCPPPVFFAKEGEGWRYEGTYFDQREKHAFVDPDIF